MRVKPVGSYQELEELEEDCDSHTARSEVFHQQGALKKRPVHRQVACIIEGRPQPLYVMPYVQLMSNWASCHKTSGNMAIMRSLKVFV